MCHCIEKGNSIVANADLHQCYIDPEQRKPEGPFGDHLGYYSLAHDFPVFRVDKVYHRRDALWAFTVVGRPPQEDTIFGELIHEITGPVIPVVIPGVHAVHAVDAAGVHPLLLAIGSERYTPYEERHRPQELLTQANAILGQGQMSLAKYLLITAREDNPQLNINDIPAFLRHLLERVDWRRDLHFRRTYHHISLIISFRSQYHPKVIILLCGEQNKFQLKSTVLHLPDGFFLPEFLPGILVLSGPKHSQTRGE